MYRFSNTQGPGYSKGVEDANSARFIKPIKDSKGSGLDFDEDERYETDYVIDDIGVSNLSFEDITPDEANWNPI